MVKEITAYKDEITGKIFKTFSEAKESEAKSKEKLEEKEVTNFVNELAKKYGYKDWSELLWNLRSNSFAIKNAGVKLRIDLLAERGVLSFPTSEIKSNLESLVIKALSYVKDENVTVRVILDKKDGFKYKHKIQEEKSVQNVEKNVYFGYSMYDDGKKYVYISNERQNYYFNDLFMLDDIVDFGNGMKHIDISTVDENKLKEEIYENFKPILEELENNEPDINLQWIFDRVYRDRIK